MICFSHKETSYYTNISFSGENIFRLYRQSYPDFNIKKSSWRLGNHKSFFPELISCRKEIIAGLDYSSNKECYLNGQNETRFQEINVLLGEYRTLTETLNSRMREKLDARTRQFVISLILVCVSGTYTFLGLICKCFCCLRKRRNAAPKRKEKPKVRFEENNHRFYDSTLPLTNLQDNVLIEENHVNERFHTIKVATV